MAIAPATSALVAIGAFPLTKTALYLALPFLLALIVAVVLTPLLIRAALRSGWVDHPDTRKVHTRPVPRVGGIAIFAGLTVGLACTYLLGDRFPVAIPPRTWAVWLGALTLFATGLYDDLYGLGFKRKFVVQLVVAYVMVAAGFHFQLGDLPFVGELGVYHQLWIALPFTLLWIVGIINAVNLLDGLDGLAAGVSLIAVLALSVAFAANGDLGMLVLAAALGGSILGFLAFNFNPASIFMGDSGSLVLGFLLAMYSIQGTAHPDAVLALLIPVVALGLPIMDTSVTFFRRLASNRSPFMPDGDHIHHRVRNTVGSHKGAVLVLYGVSVSFGATAVLLALGGGIRAVLLVALLVGFVYVVLRQLGYVRVTTALRRLYIRRMLRRRAEERDEQSPTRPAPDAWSPRSEEAPAGERLVEVPS